ncbi:MAG: FdhF/YdeP family oxidoreductase [bacterium]
MAKYKVNSGGGWPAIRYALDMAKKAGGLKKLYSALKSSNTCKTCALGMGGKTGGMRNEIDQGFQVCKKSMQTQAQDMQAGIPKEFFERNSLKNLSQLSGRELEALGRLIYPLYLAKGATHFQVIPWARALELLLENWRSAKPERSFFYSSGRSSNEAAFLMQLLARQWGSNNINNCSYYCHQASGVGLTQSLGSGTSTVHLEDVQKADLMVLIGANPASNHPRFINYLVNLRRRGGRVVVINPFRELGLQRFKVPSDLRSLFFGADIADLYLQPHCGGDLALLKAAAVHLWREKKVDLQFLKNHCNNLEEFKKDLDSEDLDSLVQKSGVSFDELKAFCDLLCASQNTIFAWAMGITQHLHGVENVRTIANLALLRGMIGKPGAGLLPLRGHSNVQGVGTVGVVPKVKPAMAEAFLKQLNITLSATLGKDTFNCVKAAYEGKIDFAVLLGGNLYGASPDQTWATKALSQINFTAYISTTLNLGHIHGHGKNTLILPVRARDEETQSTSQESMFNFVRLSLGGQKAPADELPSESELLVQVGKNLLGEKPVPWSKMGNHHEIRQFISRTVPNMHPIAQLDSANEFTIPGRIRHTPKFNTPDGKANLAVVEALDSCPKGDYFNLMTMRSEGQFNTIVYEDEDLYRGVAHRQVVFMDKEDILANGLTEGDQVWVESEVGKMKVELVEGPIRVGNVAMYYPEANAVVPGKIDPQSKTPAFKRTAVRIYKDTKVQEEKKAEKAVVY